MSFYSRNLKSPARSFEEMTHGDKSYELAKQKGIDPDSILDLSASLNPLAPDITSMARNYLSSLRRYPDSRVAQSQLAEAIGVTPECLILTNGGSEAISLVASLKPEGQVIEPEFSLYRHHLKTVGASFPIWRSNPSNPLGKLLDNSEKADVYDEAFYQLATGTWSRGAFEKDAFTLGSLTKLFACPGLRMGYIIAPDENLANTLRNIQSKWSVGSLALSLIPDLIELASKEMKIWARGIEELRDDLVALFCSFGFIPYDSDANYIVVPGVRHLIGPLSDKGIFVRDAKSFGLDAIRVAVANKESQKRLETALFEICMDKTVHG
ncbi:MAG: aminotransferase class I/II-fold pyridoxal phosphate-dependent enzyme [Acidimicrobiales bacterium]|nr:aminotransferase class I/II-fold pyridoxal phosphate-dependent enzyme [Acidimicrobiales bacterium]